MGSAGTPPTKATDHRPEVRSERLAPASPVTPTARYESPGLVHNRSRVGRRSPKGFRKEPAATQRRRTMANHTHGPHCPRCPRTQHVPKRSTRFYGYLISESVFGIRSPGVARSGREVLRKYSTTRGDPANPLSERLQCLRKFSQTNRSRVQTPGRLNDAGR